MPGTDSFRAVFAYQQRFVPEVRPPRSAKDRAGYKLKQQIADFIREHARQGRDLLEIGGFNGWQTVAYRDQLEKPGRTVIYDWQDFRFEAVKRETEFARVDLEGDRFPDATGSFDVVVCNQVFEHLKNVTFALAEVARVLRVGGHFVFSVPNNCALHNCLLFLAGRQPTATRIIGPHVRGFNIWDTSRFLELNGHFGIVGLRGFGVVPLTAVALPGFLKTWCYLPVWCLVRKASTKPDWYQVLKGNFTSTNYT